MAAEKTIPGKPANIADCDRHIWEEWLSLRDDPKADTEHCRVQIDIWLDARLQLMRKAKRKR